MQRHRLGKLWPVSALTLGGGGLGMVWGETTFEECVATVHDGGRGRHQSARPGAELWQRQGRGGGRRSLCRQTAGWGAGHQQVQSRRAAARRDRAACCADRSRAACAGCACRGSICSFCIRMSCPIRTIGAPARRRRADDALRDLCRPCPPGLRTAGRRGADRRLGSDRHRPSGHDHPAARRTPGARRRCNASPICSTRPAGSNSSTARQSRAR